MNILLGVTGSVAATLTKKMVAALQSLGSVEVVMTNWGEYFISPYPNVKVWLDADEWHKRDGCGITTLFKVWTKKGDPVRHIDLRKWADVLVIAPLSANTMAKMANGICDNLLTSVYRAWDRTRPVIVAPAMNTMMWEHPITKTHVDTLIGWGVKVVFPVLKKLACDDEGVGAMAQIDDIARVTKERCGALV